jgi:hypothetical protein
VERDWDVIYVGSMMGFGREAWGLRSGMRILGGMLGGRGIGFVRGRRGGCRGGGIVWLRGVLRSILSFDRYFGLEFGFCFCW